MAEFLFRHRLGEDASWGARSAGVFAFPGSPASEGATAALSELGIDAAAHRSQALSEELVREAALIAVMTEAHRQEVLAQFPDVREKVRLLTEFGTGAEEANISDPVGQSLNVYRYTRDQIDRAIADLILYIRERWGLSAPPDTKGNPT